MSEERGDLLLSRITLEHSRVRLGQTNYHLYLRREEENLVGQRRWGTTIGVALPGWG